ncbi:hypothetical protein HOLleu_07915 [Holothuria leucospilota]|uniref:sphingomyelin phosphodiesterase n=1 Tax=Holothuria leucospilota TaxID=206669 RepID=A0A9Q1HGH2_HOLLE|nr:hypothetical protein HOLleu_07915 [Holothuria leucospilota]
MNSIVYTVIISFFCLTRLLTAAQCPTERGPLTVWLADATNCQADEAHCNRFGLDYVCSEEIVNPHPNATCQVGVKALCSFPPIPSSLVETPANTFKQLAYNVWELRYLYYQIGQRERTCRIIPETFRRHPDLDAIIFNEAFMGGCIAGFNLSYSGEKLTFRDILHEYGFKYITATIGNPPTPRKFENGGIFIASKWPILEEDNVIYEATQPLTADDLSQKGASYAKIQKTVGSMSRVYHVLGTHLQATDNIGSDNVRRNQAREMHGLMLSKNIPPHEPVIYGGDLNADRFSDLAADIFEILDASMPVIVGDQNYTKDKTINDIYDGKGSQKWIDYVLYSNAHLQPSKLATVQVVIPKTDDPFGVCLDEVRVWPRPLFADNPRCRKTKNITDLADHFAVMGHFQYEEDVTVDVTPTHPPTPPVVATTIDPAGINVQPGFPIYRCGLMMPRTAMPTRPTALITD